MISQAYLNVALFFQVTTENTLENVLKSSWEMRLKV